MRCGRAVRLITVKYCAITVQREGHLDGIDLAHWLTLAKQRALIGDDACRFTGLRLSLRAPREETKRGYEEDKERYFFLKKLHVVD